MPIYLYKIDDQIDSMFGSTWLSTLDLTKSYYQIKLDFGSQEYTDLQCLLDYINRKSFHWV